MAEDLRISILISEVSQAVKDISKVDARLLALEKTGTNTTGKIGRGFQQAANEVPVLGRSVSLLANPFAIATAGAVGLFAAVRSFVSAAADLEQTQVSFNTIIGNTQIAQKTLNDLIQFAAKTPFQLPDIERSARSLLAFGFGADSVTNELRRLGDIASGVSIPISELSALYGKLRVQGRAFSEDINQLTGRGIPIIAELAKQFGVTESEVKKLVESGAVGFPEIEKAFRALTNEGGRFFGLTAAQSQTFNGLLSTFRDQLTLIARAFGQELLPLAKQFLQFLLSAAEGTVIFVKALKENIDIITALGVALGAAVIGFNAVNIATAVSVGLFTKLPALIAAAGASFQAFTAALLANPIGLIVTAIGALAAALIVLYNRNIQVRAAFNGFFSGLQAGFKELLRVGAEFFQGYQEGIRGILTLDPVLLGSSFSRLKGVFSEGFADIGKSAADAYRVAYTDTLLNAQEVKVISDEQEAVIITDVTATGKRAGAKLVEGMFFGIDSLSNSLNERISNTLIPTDVLDRVFNNELFGDRIPQTIDKIKPKIDDLSRTIGRLRNQLIQDIGRVGISAFENLGRAIGEALNPNSEAYGDFAKAFREFVQQLLVEVPKLIGLFLIQSAVATGFPAGLGLLIAGVGLVGLSGLLGGLFGGSGRSVAPSTGLNGQETRTSGPLSGSSLGNFGRDNLNLTNVINISLDVDGIARELNTYTVRQDQLINGN